MGSLLSSMYTSAIGRGEGVGEGKLLMTKDQTVTTNQQSHKDDGAQFRAVVKRLLDTPPMHKTKTAVKPPRRSPSKKQARTD
jgi:hypothetical protein